MQPDDRDPRDLVGPIHECFSFIASQLMKVLMDPGLSDEQRRKLIGQALDRAQAGQELVSRLAAALAQKRGD